MKPTDYLNEWVNRITPYAPGKTIDGTTKLASNENSYGPSPKVIAGLREYVPQVFRYPHKNLHVKEAIADYCRVKPENVVISNGSDEMVELLIKAFKGPVASHYPSFVSYGIYSQILNREYMSSALNPDFSFNAQKYIKETWKANLLFLCSPNNPTGTVIDIRDIEEIAQTGKIVAVDEAYFEYHGTTAKNLLLNYPNVIIMRTMAKAFGLAGMRIGYALADPEIAEAIKKVRGPFTVNYLAQEATILALKDTDYMKKIVNRVITDRNAISKRLAEKYRVIPSNANFILADVTPLTSREFFEKMLEQKIVVRPQPPFHGFPGNWVRITVGTTEENYKLLDAISKM
ncbi:MAG: histidinol-phosphate transaminase [Candidatus Altiarchaeia archaeon]